MKNNRGKPVSTHSKDTEETKPSYEELIKIISNLNKTIERLSNQLEEERKRKTPKKPDGTARAELPAPEPQPQPTKEPSVPAPKPTAKEQSSSSDSWTTVPVNKRKSTQGTQPQTRTEKPKETASKEEGSSTPSTKKARLTQDQLLVRPILSYGCPIWSDISAGTMEKLRTFERKCLRVCLSKYRTPESNYTKLISNHRLYEKAKIIRNDLFLLKLIHNHWANTVKITCNSLMCHLPYPNPLYFTKTLKTGYTPPESFIFLDSEGYIQNPENIPIL
ncbi:uncharacterized protein LOC143264617 [Megachile rotundata]|uniref:uncharacterized protein LOC143264617 n=1 Tax=Megachile rotundata TaxID=143995 RepID=UPI003FD26041